MQALAELLFQRALAFDEVSYINGFADAAQIHVNGVVHTGLEDQRLLVVGVGRQMALCLGLHVGVGFIVVMHAADQFHERLFEHAERLLDGQCHQSHGDEEIAGVVQEVKRTAGR